MLPCGGEVRDDALPPALLSKLHRRVIPALWLGFAFNVINRSNLAFAAIEMAPALGLSQADTGFAAGVFFMGYAGMQVPSNLLMVHVGARRVLSTCLVAWGVLSSATGLVSDASGLFLLRFLLGLAQSGYYSGCMLLLRGFFPTRESAHAIALFVTSGAAGTILCSLSSGLIMSATDGLLGLAGWRWLFLLQGLPPVALGCVLPSMLCERPAEAQWLTPSELARLSRASEAEAREDEARAPLLPARQAVRAAVSRLPTWLFMAQYFALNAVTYMVMFFLPTQLTQIFPDLAAWQVGLLNAVPALLKMALGPPVAALADRHDSSRLSFAWGLFACCGTAMLAASLLMHTGPAVLVPLALLLATLSEGCAVAIFWSVHHRRQPAAIAPCSIALVNSVGNLGGFAGTFVLGYLHDALGRSDHAGTGAPTSGGIGDWAGGTAALGLAFLLVTCVTGALLRDGTRGRFRP